MSSRDRCEPAKAANQTRPSATEDIVVQFLHQFFIRLAAITVACLLAVFGYMASIPDENDRPTGSIVHSADPETAR